MKNDNDKSNTYLAVIPVASRPTQMPVFGAALEQVLKLFGQHIQVVCVTPRDRSYWWNEAEWINESSRKIAQDADGMGFAGMFLLTPGRQLPAGLMCWLEFFPHLKDDPIAESQLLTCFLPERKRHMLVGINNPEHIESFDEFYARLYRDVLSPLQHKPVETDSKTERTSYE